MKRILLVFLTLIAISCAGFAQDIIYRDQATLQWDDAAVYLPEDVVTYEVYIYDSATVINDQIVANLIYVGETAALEMLIVFPERRNWYAGVRTKVVTGEPMTSYSVIVWSYDAGVVATVPFVYQPLGGVVVPPDNLRDSGM